MKLFGRSRSVEAPASEPAAPPERRRAALACANCRTLGVELVYLDNGRDYCRPCAIRCWEQMRFRPAGKRPTDITLEQLLA
ncbi:MAG: hypothetical protein IT299_02700 [Dehalococcoidia bacterium]|nr:hypothetical protein [Dehalococcoidia bacterium]